MVDKKFIETFNIDDWEIETDTGWSSCIAIGKTIPFTVYNIVIEGGFALSCADEHIVFDKNMNETLVKNLELGMDIHTITGLKPVIKVEKTQHIKNMFDIQVDSHQYYTNGILSHNTTIAAGYILWYAMFVPDSTILIAAHKYAGALEIMNRVRFAYENAPDYIRAGARTYNKGSIEFDNGSRIVSASTTENTGRGMSISLLYCLSGGTMITVRDTATMKIKTIPLEELYTNLKFIE